MTKINIEQVAAIIRETAAEEILPRFGRLAQSDIREKGPNDLVTIADELMEVRLTAALADLLPGSLVVGEEACAADPSVRDQLDGDEWVWVIDPVDGTSNFAAARPHIACLVALVHRGETVAGWIYDPLKDRMALTEKGAGTRIDGQSVPDAGPVSARPTDWYGSMSTRFFPPPYRKMLEEKAKKLARSWPLYCAGQDYLRLLDNDLQFAIFYRTLPWDHAAGVLAVEEAGGRVGRFGGAPYRPSDRSQGLMIVRNPEMWHWVEEFLDVSF